MWSARVRSSAGDYCERAAQARPSVMQLTVIPLIVTALYLLAPGHPDLPLRGLPTGLTGAVALIGLVTAFAWSRARDHVARPPRALIAVLAVACALKLALAIGATPSGWVARYYANEAFQPPLERSTDYKADDRTRVDRTIDFSDTTFPVHFFNEYRFNHGFRREYTDPFSVHWSGYVRLPEARTLALVAEAKGALRVEIDGGTVIDLASPATLGRAQADAPLQVGEHLIEVRYVKPAETEGLVRVLRADDGPTRVMRDEVSPQSTPGWRRSIARPLVVVGWLAHAMVFVALVWWLGRAVSSGLREVGMVARRDIVSALDLVATPSVMLLLVAQGCWKARHLVDHVWTLTAGDDWFAFETEARDILIHGPMMTEGAIVGRGEPFFYYPGYGYFLAIVHRITGESLAGVILVNFLMLALATVLVYRLARLLVGPRAALGALAWLLVLEQADFVRYYTVTLLSENLFVSTSAATVFALTRYLTGGSTRHLILAAIAGGVSALTRPSIMLFLPLAIVLVAISRWRRSGVAPAVTHAIVFVAIWMITIAPATIRNFIMSGDPVLIAAGQAKTFITYNLPSGEVQQYNDAFDGTMASAGVILIRILLDHPAEFLSNIATKLGFTLGMVHWMGGAISPHPELVVTSALYILGLVVVPQARALAAAPLHFFVVTHLATLMLTMPSNYGYRLLLPMYLFMPVVAAATTHRACQRIMARASSH